MVVDEGIIQHKTVFKIAVVKFVGRVDLTKHVIGQLTFAERFDIIVASQQVADGVAIQRGSSADDAWADVTEEDYVKIKRKVADEMITHLEEIMGFKVREHIEEIEIASPVTFARYMYTPQGSVYGYCSEKWDGMSSRTLVNGIEKTIPGLFFVGGHGSALSGYFPTYTGGNRTGLQILGYVMSGGGN